MKIGRQTISPSSSPSSQKQVAHPANLGILPPKPRHKFVVLFDMDDAQHTLGCQTIRVEPRLGADELVIVFSDDVDSKVVDLLNRHVGGFTQIAVHQLDNNALPICKWEYYCEFADFQPISLDYSSSQEVEIAALFLVQVRTITH